MTKSDFITLVATAIVDVPLYNVLNFNEQEIGNDLYDKAVDMAVRSYNTLPSVTAFTIESLSDSDIGVVLDLAIAEALFMTAMKHLRNQVLQQSVIVQENDKFSQYMMLYQKYKDEALARAREYKHNKDMQALSLALTGCAGVQYE